MAVCVSCGFSNADGLKFCGECGTRLTAPAVVGGRERKVASVLFCDLVGFTSASDGADPEDVQAALTPYHGRARAEIERFGGTVEKFIGDAVMAVFGAPVAHEDDPERAVRAGLRLLDAVGELNAEHGLELAVRIGVATGEAVVSTGAAPERGEGMVAGDVVNTAARLQTAAPVGAVLVGESTWRATRAVIDYQALEPVAVKGKAEALPVWAAHGARSRVGEATASTSTPLVGRADELEMLQRTFTRSVREASVQLVTIVAEPGVGKSRLVQEFFEWVDRREELVTWRQGRCLSYGEGITFWAVGQIVKAHAGILDTDPTDVVSTKLTETVTALVPDPSQVGWLVARLAPLVGLAGGESSREELFTAWQRFFEAVATTSPLVIVIEDLHWADEALLALCEHLLQWVVGVPLLLVATARPELFDKAPNWGAGHRNATTIGLTPLSDAQTAQLITGLLGTAVLPATTHALLLQRAGGNPLYAEEFIRMLADQGQLPSAAGPGEVAELGDVFPESVQAIIAARLDTLPAESKALLHDASVVGHMFWSGAVAALSGRDEPSVRSTLHELSRRDYLRPARISTLAGQSEYTFGHALIAEVTYSQIPRATRAAKHTATAQWLEALAGDAPGEQAAIIAHHYATAHALTQATGGDPASASALDELADQARHWHTLAAEHALAMDPATAETHYRTALTITDVSHPRYPHLLTGLADVLISAGRFSEAETTYREAETHHHRHGETMAAATAALSRCYVMGQAGHVTESTELLDSTIAVLETYPAGPELVEAYAFRAGDHAQVGRFQQGVHWAEAALNLAGQLASPLPDRVRVKVLANRGGNRWLLGDAAGEQDLQQALALAEQQNLTDNAIACYANLGLLKQIADSPAAALPDLERTLTLSLERGRYDFALSGSGAQAEALLLLGRLDEAFDLCERMAADGQASESSLSLTYLLAVKAQILVMRGRFDLAEAILQQVLPAAREAGVPAFLLPVLTAAIQSAQRRSDDATGAQLTAELATVLDPATDALSCQYLAEIARILAPAGRTEIVAEMIAAAPRGLAQLDANVLTARAAIAESANDVAQATELYQEAVGRWRSYGCPYEEAHALLGAGRCNAQLGRPAADLLQRAHDICAALGAEPLLTDVVRELQRLPA